MGLGGGLPEAEKQLSLIKPFCVRYLLSCSWPHLTQENLALPGRQGDQMLGQGSCGLLSPEDTVPEQSLKRKEQKAVIYTTLLTPTPDQTKLVCLRER